MICTGRNYVAAMTVGLLIPERSVLSSERWEDLFEKDLISAASFDSPK